MLKMLAKIWLIGAILERVFVIGLMAVTAVVCLVFFNRLIHMNW